MRTKTPQIPHPQTRAPSHNRTRPYGRLFFICVFFFSKKHFIVALFLKKKKTKKFKKFQKFKKSEPRKIPGGVFGFQSQLKQQIIDKTLRT